MASPIALHLPAAPVSIRSRSVARYALATARVLVGLLFLMSGLDGFLHFIPQPTAPVSEGAVALGIAFMKSGYLMQLIAGTEAVVGALLVANRFVPLALVILAPVVVNIFAFHLFLAPSGLVLASIIAAVEIALAWQHRAAFRSVVAARA
jgi:uncharacterized membrane protein YphA (DoxX/SURF4 family)